MVKLPQYEMRGLDEAGAPDSDNPMREGVSEGQLRWYLVQCRARQEERALEHLQRQGFECYRPLYERECIRRRRKHLEIVGLFPGYLFIRLDQIHDNWLPIRSTRGVLRMVRFKEYPSPVPDRIIAEIRQRIERQPIREPYLKSGERVIIAEGSFSGVEAIFVACDGVERVMLLLNLLQRELVMSFPVESVRKSDRYACPT